MKKYKVLVYTKTGVALTGKEETFNEEQVKAVEGILEQTPDVLAFVLTLEENKKAIIPTANLELEVTSA